MDFLAVVSSLRFLSDCDVQQPGACCGALRRAWSDIDVQLKAAMMIPNSSNRQSLRRTRKKDFRKYRKIPLPGIDVAIPELGGNFLL